MKSLDKKSLRYSNRSARSNHSENSFREKSQTLSKHSTKAEKAQNLAIVIGSFSRQFNPDDQDEDPIVLTKKFMESSESSINNLLKTIYDDKMEEAYKPVLRLLDTSYVWNLMIAKKIKSEQKAPGSEDKGEEKKTITSEEIESRLRSILLIIRSTLQSIIFKTTINPESSLIDWRIARKLLSIKKLFSKKSIQITKNEILKSFQNQVENALEFITWQKDDPRIEYSKWILRRLKFLLDNDHGMREEGKSVGLMRFMRRDHRNGDRRKGQGAEGNQGRKMQRPGNDINKSPERRGKDANEESTELTANKEQNDERNKDDLGQAWRMFHRKTPEQKKIIEKSLLRAIIKGRFDKKIFGFDHTLILGEDGGLFVLLNNKSYLNESMILSGGQVNRHFLMSKTDKKITPTKILDQITLGKGGFGTVRFALSLFESEKANPGDIVCVKKSKSFYSALGKKSEEEILFDITESTINDYFASDIAEIVKAPFTLDMAVIHDPKIDLRHLKAYLMMEVLPQNTGKSTFDNKQYQKWEYQKPYLIDVFEGTRKLLSDNIAQTDLKLENTLFDTLTRRATIIDLGGIIKFDSPEELKNFKPSEGGYEFTEGYCPPELNIDNEEEIDLNKSLVFSCAVVLQKTIENTDLGSEETNKLQMLIAKAKSDWRTRCSIEELIEEVRAIGNDNYKEEALSRAYIGHVLEKIEKDRSSISLNEDLLKAREIFINIEVVKQNPFRFENQPASDLFDEIDDFLKNKEEKVLLLLGSAGSGKSLGLQLKFYEYAKKWTARKPLPIYFNLANEVNLRNNFDVLNKQLGISLEPDKGVYNLFLDSFDEGYEMDLQREGLIKGYLDILKPGSKIVITCRTEYLNSENDLEWFTPKGNENDFKYFYLAPINYNPNKNLREYARKWLEKKDDEFIKKLNSTKNNEVLEFISRKEIISLIDTGFTFELIMTTIPKYLEQYNEQEYPLTKSLMYNIYADIYIEERVAQLKMDQISSSSDTSIKDSTTSKGSST